MDNATLQFVINDLRAQHRRREDLMRAAQRLNLQAQAICRRLCDGSKSEAKKLFLAAKKGQDHPLLAVAMLHIEDLLAAECMLLEAKKAPEKNMVQHAKTLPVWPWVEGVAGISALGLAQIIAETGDLSNYANPDKVKKRMGLAVMDGVAQGRLPEGIPVKERAESWKARGYSPRRRSIMWNVGCSFIRSKGPMYDSYLERKSVYQNAFPERRPIHIHRMAQRVIEQKFLCELWGQWKKATQSALSKRAA